MCQAWCSEILFSVSSHPHSKFMQEDPEAEREKAPSPRSHSEETIKLTVLRQPDSRAQAWPHGFTLQTSHSSS